MKLKTLAIAVAVASVPFAAQADFAVSGDVSVGYFKSIDGSDRFGGNGSEVIFDASEKVGDLTYFGHFEVNVAGATVNSSTNVEGDSNEASRVTLAGQLSSDDMYVGVKGAFGSVQLGDTDNGCDATDVGFVASDEYISHDSGGCKASDQNNITYKKTSGSVTYAASYSPDVDAGSANAGEDTFAIGVKGKIGPAAVSLGYESETSLSVKDANGVDVNRGSNIVLGVAGTFGPVTLGVRANEFENGGNSTHVGYTALYAAGSNKFYAGIGDTDRDTYFIGYQRAIGKNSSFIAEFVEDDADITEVDANGVSSTRDSDTAVAIGFKHNF